MRIAFVYRGARMARLESLRKGEAPSEFFLGAAELEKAGFDIGYFDPPRYTGLTKIALKYKFKQRFGLVPGKLTGRQMSQLNELCERLNEYDCIVATSNQIAFALSELSLLGRLHRPIIGIQCGLLNDKHSFLQRRSVRGLLANMYTMLYGESELAPMIRKFRIDPEKIFVNQFGVDIDFWNPGEPVPGDYVLAIGNDENRDYTTLVAAAAQIPLPVHIITKQPLPAELPSNVVHHRGSWHSHEITDARLRELYQGALCVVVPIKQTIQPSGQSVTLQAMACGRPVILTRFGGLWSSESIRDGENVLLVEPANPDDLAAKVNRLIENSGLRIKLASQGRETAMKRGNIAHFAQNLRKKCEDLLKK